MKEIDSINGRIAALSMALTEVMASLPQLCAAEAAVRLLIAQAEARQEDQEVDAEYGRARDSILDVYVELLSTRAKTAG